MNKKTFLRPLVYSIFIITFGCFLLYAFTFWFGVFGMYLFAIVLTLGGGTLLIIGALRHWNVVVDPPLDKFPFRHIYGFEIYKNIKKSYPKSFYFIHLIYGIIFVLISIFLSWSLYAQTKGFTQWWESNGGRAIHLTNKFK